MFGRNAQQTEPELPRRRIERFLAAADKDLYFIPLTSQLNNSVRLVQSGPSAGLAPAQAIWEIKTRNGDHFVSATRSNHLNDERWVVMVEARRFYAVWLASRNQPTGMPNDPPDYHDLPKMNAWNIQPSAWSHGMANPVPLAEIGNSFISSPHCHMGFTNGRNRLAWLIYHGAAAFPIEIIQNQAPMEVFRMMGVNGFPPTTVDALTS